MKKLILIFIALIAVSIISPAQDGLLLKYPSDLVFDYEVDGPQTFIATNSISFQEGFIGRKKGSDVQSYLVTEPKDNNVINSSKTNNVINNFEILNGINISPNPFSTKTTINYSISKTGKVKVSVLNSMTEKVNELVNETQSEGSHQLIFDGSKLNNGVYYILFESDNFRKVGKIVLVK